MYNPLHGNCYIFNSGWNSSVELKRSTKSGRMHGERTLQGAHHLSVLCANKSFDDTLNKNIHEVIVSFYDVILPLVNA